jgi:hypothetical protein
MEIAVALIFWAAVNTAGTWMVCKHFHDKLLKAVALNNYQRSNATDNWGDWKKLEYPSMGRADGEVPDEQPSHRPPREPLAVYSPEYEEIFKSVRGKC